MPVEGVVTRINDLDARWPRNSDIVREGAQHIRNIKVALLEEEKNNVGFVSLFYGALQDIPAGWVVCDGQNGTPDMRGRVPVGAGGQYALGATGGADSVTLTTAQLPPHSHGGKAKSGGLHGHSASSGNAGSHSHSVSTENAGEHRHGYKSDNDSNAGGGSVSKSDNQFERTNYTEYAGLHNHVVNISSAGLHNHIISISQGGTHEHDLEITNTGSEEAHENRMPYLALHFIMKIE